MFYLDQHALVECVSYKYLGHYIFCNRNDDLDISRQCRFIYAKGNALIRKFYKCSDDVKVTLFKSKKLQFGFLVILSCVKLISTFCSGTKPLREPRSAYFYPLALMPK